MENSKQKLVLSTHLQELALLILGNLPIKDPIQKAAHKSRGRILAELNPQEKELYLASRDVILEFGRQLTRCENLPMLAKALQIIQGITQGQIKEYEEVKHLIIDQVD